MYHGLAVLHSYVYPARALTNHNKLFTDLTVQSEECFQALNAAESCTGVMEGVLHHCHICPWLALTQAPGFQQSGSRLQATAALCSALGKALQK